MAEAGREEAYVLRFVDAALAARVRATLSEEPDADPADAHMELDFDGEGKSFFFFVSRFVKPSSKNKKKNSTLKKKTIFFQNKKPTGTTPRT